MKMGKSIIEQKKIKIWNYKSKECMKIIETADVVYCLAIIRDECNKDVIVSGGGDQIISRSGIGKP